MSHFTCKPKSTQTKWQRCLSQARDLWLELWHFGLKQIRACVFAGSFFLILWLSTLIQLSWLPRYDVILLATLILQWWLWRSGIESSDEIKAISLFHLIGLVLEIFKTQPSIGSWSYPEWAYSKVFNVPLYAGFMHAAVASYMMQAWRQLDLQLDRYPPHSRSLPLAIAIYTNFFSHHFINDVRWWLMILVVLVFWPCTVAFTAHKKRRSMPLVLSFVLIGFFIWIAENISTALGAWVYPNQTQGWQFVHPGKISSWILLAIITFIIVADLKHWRARRAD